MAKKSHPKSGTLKFCEDLFKLRARSKAAKQERLSFCARRSRKQRLIVGVRMSFPQRCFLSMPSWRQLLQFAPFAQKISLRTWMLKLLHGALKRWLSMLQIKLCSTPFWSGCELWGCRALGDLEMLQQFSVAISSLQSVLKWKPSVEECWQHFKKHRLLDTLKMGHPVPNGVYLFLSDRFRRCKRALMVYSVSY